ncbi:hypothetical protein R1sor_009010 [Riccia sorocarpa]|uniref:Uncharacterized protein n=1 Tax=Riccia sorocarpa TaxID=122646 RepID=A0ABD3H6G5_9MARC
MKDTAETSSPKAAPKTKLKRKTEDTAETSSPKAAPKSKLKRKMKDTAETSSPKAAPKTKLKRKTEDTAETSNPKPAGKRKADDTAEEGTPKKPQNVKAKPAKSVDVDAMKRLPKKEEEKLMKTDFNKFLSMYPFDTDDVFPISVEKIMEAPSIYVYRSVIEFYVLEMLLALGYVPKLSKLYMLNAI